MLYLPPIHPIGTTNRQGRRRGPDGRPGGPGHALGHRRSRRGPHRRPSPSSGRSTTSDHLVTAAAASGIDVALDLAFQCSPDHPWVREHPEWFRHRPDGSIRYAENPPKRYEDIFPLDFETEDWRALWARAARGGASSGSPTASRVFRVDNPHTKPLRLLGVADRLGEGGSTPRSIFLAEAFTRPKVMYRLAKVGFTQSYTYFTWRQREVGARDLPDRADRRPRSPTSSGPTSGRIPPTSSPSSCRQAVAPVFCPAAGPGRHPGRQLRHLRPGLRAAGARSPPARVRGVPPLGEVRDPALGPGAARQPGRPRRPAQPHPPWPPGAAVQRLAPVPRERQRADHRVLQVASGSASHGPALAGDGPTRS